MLFKKIIDKYFSRFLLIQRNRKVNVLEDYFAKVEIIINQALSALETHEA